MKRIVPTLLLALSAFAVQAQTPPAEAAPPAQDEASEVITGDTVADAKAERNCVRETGSRTAKPDEHGCNGLPGDSYDKDTIDRTGATTTSEALRKLGH